MLGSNRYGKANVKFLRVVKDSAKHEPHEFVGQIMLHGPFETAFTNGTNESIVPTETQKNTVYALSKKYDIDPLERWVVLAARDVMTRHKHVTGVDMDFTRLPWHRMTVDGKAHNHAFIRGSDGNRFVRAHIPRNGPVTITSGFKNVRVMKTTQSGFEGYIVDEYTTLKPTRDRVMATEIYCEYSFVDGVDIEKTPFSAIAEAVKSMTLDRFAGPPEKQTIHQIGTAVLERFPLIDSIRFALPNIHFYAVEFNDFKDPSIVNNREVFFTFDGAHGQIEATIQRKKHSKL